MKKIISKFTLAVLMGSILIGVPLITFAQGIKDKTMLNSIAAKAGVSEQDDAQDIVGTAIKALLSVIGLVFLILMVYAGILWMTARGDESKVEKARDIIQAAVIGLFVTVSAYAITVFVTTRFSN